MTVQEFCDECVRLVTERGFAANERDLREYAEEAYYRCKRYGIKNIEPKKTVRKFCESVLSRSGGVNLRGAVELSRYLKRV